MIPPLLLSALLLATPATQPTVPPAVAEMLAVAERPGVTADELVSAMDAVSHAPVPDRDRRDDPAYMEQYQQTVRQYVRAWAALQFRFVDEFPTDPRAPEILSWAVANTMNGDGPEATNEQYRDRGLSVIASLRPRYAAHPKLGQSLSAMEVYYQRYFGGMSVDDLVAAVDRLSVDDPQNETLADLLFRAAYDAEGEVKARLVRKLADEFPDTAGGRQALAVIRHERGPGQPFEFRFTDEIIGREVSSDALRGKIVVVDFWATWCAPCVEQMPKLKAAYEKFHGRGVEFVGISLDDNSEMGGREKLLAFVRENNIPWPQWYQGKAWESEFSQSWVSIGIPTVFVVGRDGNLVSLGAGDDLDAILADLVADRPDRSLFE